MPAIRKAYATPNKSTIVDKTNVEIQKLKEYTILFSVYVFKSSFSFKTF